MSDKYLKNILPRQLPFIENLPNATNLEEAATIIIAYIDNHLTTPKLSLEKDNLITAIYVLSNFICHTTNNTELFQKQYIDFYIKVLKLKLLTPCDKITLNKLTQIEEVIYLNEYKVFSKKQESIIKWCNLIQKKSMNNKKKVIEFLDKIMASFNSDSFIIYINEFSTYLNFVIENECCDEEILLKKLKDLLVSIKNNLLTCQNKDKFKMLELLSEYSYASINILKKRLRQIENMREEIRDLYTDTFIIKSNIVSVANPLDLTKEYTITIDDISTLDIDDALSITETNYGYRLLVFIADTTNFNYNNYSVMKLALQRGATIYFNDYTANMYGEFLGNHYFSLIQNHNRNVFAYIFDFDKKGTLIDIDYAKAVINVNKRLTYQEANEIIKKGNPDKMLEQTLKDLALISTILKNDYHIGLEQTNRKLDKNSMSYQIISRIAVFTNHKISKICYERQIPFQFRNCINENKAFYSPNNLGHEPLKLPCYAHITSPIRRFSDDINEMVIDKFLIRGNVSDEEYYYLESLIKNSSSHLTTSLNNANKIPKTMTYYKR